ncbi:MAG: hypothetical protein WBM04_08855 [Candidatus Korobacteraceae bacterium]
MNKEHGHGNRIATYSPDPHPPTIRKVPANSVPYGESISRNGRTVWIAMDGERLVCIAATAVEARRKYRDICRSLIAKGTGGG